MKKCAYSRYRRYPYSRERALESSRRNGGSPVAVPGVIHGHFDSEFFSFMTPGTAEEDRSPPRSENQGFRRNYFSFFGNPLTPNSSKFEISPKFCEAFFNPVKFRQIFIKICSKTREIDSKFAKNDEIWWKKLQK